MPIATGTALLISAAATGGLQLYGAHKGAKAAEKAAAQQQEGVKEARTYAEPLYNQAQQIAAQQLGQGQAGLAPYAQQGTQGLTALTALLGLPAGTAAGPAAGSAAPAGGGFGGFGVSLGQVGGAAAPSGGLPRPGATPGASPATQSSYVTLRAPTGEARPVPADQVDYYVARGAQRV